MNLQVNQRYVSTGGTYSLLVCRAPESEAVLPGGVDRLVVARLPHVAAHHTPLDVVSHQLFGITGCFPRHDD